MTTKNTNWKTSAAPDGAHKGTPSKALAVVPSGNIQDDKLLGKQLTDQYIRATGGMAEVLKFGAMMMLVRAHIDFTREVDKSKGAKFDKGTGLKAWLKEHAPTVNETTAYRFMHVAESVSRSFELPSKVDFVALATTATDELSEKLQKTQLALFEFVSGTSQRSWLDQFTPATSKGGKRVKAEDADALPEDSEEQEAIDIYAPLIEQMRHLLITDPAWAHLPHRLLTELDDVTISFRKLRSK